METRRLHVLHLLIRNHHEGSVRFLVYEHDKWKDAEGKPFLTLPSKKTVVEHFESFEQGSSLESFLEAVLKDDLGLNLKDYALEQELEPAQVVLESPRHEQSTRYTIYPLDVWVDPHRHEALKNQRERADWLTCEEALQTPRLSATARAVFRLVLDREERLNRHYALHPEKEREPDAPRRLLREVADRPTMNALARKWLSHNRGGVRLLKKHDLDEILNAGDRAFNLRVADPYLRYQMQGLGFTWSFFTEKDPQDLHVHGAPTVEIYGVLEGKLEIWWKAYHDRGTSAWFHRVLGPGDWLEIDALQCHIVQWQGAGKGVVFKAGSGPLAEVGRLGITGKTRCGDCPCMKPSQVAELAKPSAKA